MGNVNMEDIVDMYKKLGLPIDDTLDQEDAFLSHNWHSVPFGIYTEDGFNYTNNTNTKS